MICARRLGFSGRLLAIVGFTVPIEASDARIETAERAAAVEFF